MRMGLRCTPCASEQPHPHPFPRDAAGDGDGDGEVEVEVNEQRRRQLLWQRLTFPARDAHFQLDL